MDQERSLTDTVTRWTTEPRVRGFVVALFALGLLVILQVNQRNHDAPMCELFAGYRLQGGDLQRMQLAFGQQGLDSFQIRDEAILVPVSQRAEYVKAATDQNALPASLRDTESEELSVNPFMSMAQQRDVQLMRKKQQVRNMVLQLPFVQEVSFEMDVANGGTAFRQTKPTAVISLRAKEQYSLTHRHFDTVRQMIGGAIASLKPDDIVVIDLDSGLAHQQIVDPDTQHQLQIQRIALGQQRYYESRIRDALKDLSGIEVQVQVDLREICPTVDRGSRVAQQRSESVPSQLPAPGANRMVSIEVESDPSEFEPQPIETASKRVVQQAGHQQAMASTEYHKEIRVQVEVPEELVNRLQGSDTERQTASRTGGQPARFELVRSQIEARVRSMLPDPDPAAHQVNVKLIAAPQVSANTSRGWDSTFKSIQEYWPSAAVLIIGLALVMVVTRKPADQQVANSIQENQDRDVLSIDPAAESAVDGELANDDRSEERLSRLIEEDPDAAARVIESWIRDAA